MSAEAVQGIGADLDDIMTRLQAADRIEAAEIVAGMVGDATLVRRCVALAGSDGAAWESWLIRARSIRGLSRPVDTLAAAVKRGARSAHLRVAGISDKDEHAGPDDLPDGWEVPAGYRVTPGGVWQVDNDGAMTQVATRPVWPVGYFEDVDGLGHSVRVTWAKHGGGYLSRVVPWTVLMDARAIVGIGDGFPAGSHTAREVVRWLDTATSRNQECIPTRRTAGRFGWMPGGFMLGSEWVGPDDRAVVLSEDPAVQQIAEAVEPRGSMDGWLSDAMGPAVGSADAWLAVYASVASVLVERLELPENPGIDWSGSTSQGKTSVQALAASVWGDPREGRLVSSWKVSPAGIEARAVMLQHLPLILDDSKKAKRGDDVSAIIYMHSGGSGAIRGKPGAAGRSVGARVVESWRSMLISSGEQRLTSFTADAGSRARVLCLVGSPLDSREAADAVKLGAMEHHGHLGRMVLLALEVPGAVAGLRDRHAQLRDYYGAALVKHGSVAGRLGAVVALLDVARELAESAGLPAAVNVDPIGRAYRAAIDGGADADQPAEALRAVYEEAVSHRASFWGRHDRDPKDGSPRQPSGGWMGAWSDGDDYQCLDVMTRTVRAILRREGFDAGVIDRWGERGWILPSKGMGMRAEVKIDGAKARVYRFAREAIDEHCG